MISKVHNFGRNRQIINPKNNFKETVRNDCTKTKEN